MTNILRIREKIGFQEPIKDISLLNEGEVQGIIDRWVTMLAQNGIMLSFHETDPDPRKRYVFIYHVFMDILLPPHGADMVFCFMYDGLSDAWLMKEPESIARAILENLINKKTPVPRGLNRRVRMNRLNNLTEPEFHYLVNQYKQRFTTIHGISIEFGERWFEMGRLILTGKHKTRYCQPIGCRNICGEWQIEMSRIDGNWKVISIDIEGIEL
jgi:hypothetical protein